MLMLLFLSESALAQRNIVIKGHSENGSGKRVEILKRADQISQKEIIADSATIDQDGNFRLHLYTNYPMLVSMRIDNYSQSF